MTRVLELAPAGGGVHRLTIRRPEVRNALNGRAFVELAEACERVEGDASARVLVITGEGMAFSAGGDFEALGELLEADRQAVVAELERAGAAVARLSRLRVPTLAAIHGDAFGGGAALALAADFRVMAEGARLGLVFARLGLSGADTGATWFLSRVVGPARALEILTLGRVFSAAEALEEGLVTEVAGADGFDKAVDALAGRLAVLAPLAVQGTKRALSGIEERSLSEHVTLEAGIQAAAIHSADFREGLAAFSERRAPEFKGVDR